jgi:hypothetical protein
MISPEDFYLTLSALLLTHYLFTAVIFWTIETLHNKTMKSLLLGLKSPKNRVYIESELNGSKKDRMLSIVWPYLILRQFLNKFRQTK